MTRYDVRLKEDYKKGDLPKIQLNSRTPTTLKFLVIFRYTASSPFLGLTGLKG